MSPAPTIPCALPVKTNGAPPAARSSSARRVAAALGALEELEDVGAVVRPGLEDLTRGRDGRQRAQLGEAVRHVGAGQAIGETPQAREGPLPAVEVPRANQVMAPDLSVDGTLPSGYSRHSP